MPVKPLPQLQIRMPIVTSTGQPTTTFHRYFNTEFGGAIFRNQQQLEQAIFDIQAAMAAAAAAQTAADNAQVAADNAQGTVDGVIDGTVQIDNLNVGGTDVTPFLARTDGSKLVDPAGLDNEVVVTQAIQTNAVTDSDVFVNASGILLGNITPITIATTTIDASATDEVDIISTVTINANGGGAASNVNFEILRNGTLIYSGVVMHVPSGTPNLAAPTLAYSEVPGAGTHTYTVTGLLSTPATVNVLNRYMRVKRFSR